MSNDKMDNVNKTLYIPLYGKAYVSRRGLFINDRWAERIWDAEQFKLKGKSRSKWLAYYMGIRSAVFDDWAREKLSSFSDAVVIHIGCGLDSRAERVGRGEVIWFDLDFPDVISERRRYFSESGNYRMISCDIRDGKWLSLVPSGKKAIIIMEGVSMYLKPEELRAFIDSICAYFDDFSILMDCYSSLAARMSRYKNPINDVGVSSVWGIDDPASLTTDTFGYVMEHDMTPKKYIDQLSGGEKKIFERLYAGGFSRKLYRLYEFEGAKPMRK